MRKLSSCCQQVLHQNCWVLEYNFFIKFRDKCLSSLHYIWSGLKQLKDVVQSHLKNNNISVFTGEYTFSMSESFQGKEKFNKIFSDYQC